ncbi:MAG: AAA family ATPase [Candidatus Thiodiazotropha sp.]
MFESYYKLDANPFRLSADEQFRFAHKNYLKAWSHLKYALEQGEGFVMITGRPGSGKTTLIRDIISQIDSSEILAINLVTNQLQAEELLRKVALEYGLPAESYNKATLLTHIEDFVTKEYEAGRRAVIVIDEAQNLTLTGLEELRLLSNLQTGSHPLFQIFLVGQDELRSLILSPNMEQIRTRLIASCQMELMNLEQTQGYIEHRLGIVGWAHDPELDEVIYPLIHYLTEGIPRKVNHVVSRLLLYGALEEKHAFTEEDIWIVAKELFDEERLTTKDGESFTEFRGHYADEPDQQELADSDTVATSGDLEKVDAEEDLSQSQLVEAVEEEEVSDSNLAESVEDEGIGPSDFASERAAGALNEMDSVDQAKAIIQEEIEKEENERNREIKETESGAEFYPYGEELIETDATVKSEVAAEEEVCIDTTPTIPADAAGIPIDSSNENKVPAYDEDADNDKTEINLVTSKVLDVTRHADYQPSESSSEAKPEEILNLPSMQAERRKHEIEEKGGLINTVETIDIDELFSSTLGKSLRNIFLFVIAGVFFLALFVIEPGRIEQTLDDLGAKWQVKTDANEEDQDAITTEVDNKQQQLEKPEADSKQVQEVLESDEKSSITTVAKSEADQVPSTDSDMTTQTGVFDPDPVEMASKDYIATQSKYQQVEIGDKAEETGEEVSSSIDMTFQIYFEFDNPNIPEQFSEMLNDLYIVLSLNKSSTMTITGYTDSSGDPTYNMNLSAARAKAVSQYFTERGIEAERIQVEGRGPVPKTTDEEYEEFEKRFGNRRVEIILRKGKE